MGLNAVDAENAVRYLLGALPPEAGSIFEKKYFEDDELFEQLRALEYELIRDYLCGRLEPERARRFEAHYRANPALWEKVESEKLVRRQVKPTLWERLKPMVAFRGPLDFALAGISVAALVCVVWLGNENRTLRRNLAAGLRAASSSIVPTAALKPASILLTPGVRRGAESSGGLSLPAQNGELHLQLAYSGLASHAHASYRVSVRDVRGDKTVTTVPASMAGQDKVEIALRLAELPPNSYVLALEAQTAEGRFEEVESYALEIVRPD